MKMAVSATSHDTRKFLLAKNAAGNLLYLAADHLAEDELSPIFERSLYFDTADFAMARSCAHKGDLREQLRIRCCGPVKMHSGKVVVELKKKHRTMVLKRRVAMSLSDALIFIREGVCPAGVFKRPTYYEQQIVREIEYAVARYRSKGGLRPTMAVTTKQRNFTCSSDCGLTLTLNSKIRWRNWDLDLRHDTRGFRIIEKGQHILVVRPGPDNDLPLWLSQTLGQVKARPTSFCRYTQAYQHMLGLPGEQYLGRSIDAEEPLVAPACQPLLLCETLSFPADIAKNEESFKEAI